jgi:hypothetical protein
MRITGQILQDMLRGAQGLLRIDDPFGTPEGSQEALSGLRHRQVLTATGPHQCPTTCSLLEGVQEQPPEASTEDLHREKKVWATGDPPGSVGRQAPSGEDTVEMRMMVELLTPGMEHREAAEVRPEMLGVASDVLERLCHHAKEHAVQHAGIVEAQGAEGVRQCKHHMDVGDVEHLTFPGGEPGGLGGAVARGAVPIATGVRADLFVATLVARRFVAAKSGGAAEGDGAQGAVLLAGQDRAIACQEGGTILVHDGSHFEGRAVHQGCSSGNVSRGLGVAWRACGVTWR